MNVNESEKIREKLEKEYNDNLKKIKELDRKINLINSNTISNKLLIASIPALILQFAYILGPTFINIGANFNLVHVVSCILPIVIGFISQKVILKKPKEEFEKFSNSKTEKEKTEEKIKYILEKNKFKNENKIISKIYDDLSSNEKSIDALSQNYLVLEKDNNDRTEKEITSNIEKLTKTLLNNQKNIDMISKKCTLRDRFYDVRNKINRLKNIGFYTLVASYVVPIITEITFMLLSIYKIGNIVFNPIITFTPFVVGGLSGLIYSIKYNKDNYEVFNKYNNELGNNALSNSDSYKDELELNSELKKLINDTVLIRKQLEEEKIKLENKNIGNSDNESINYQKTDVNEKDFVSYVETNNQEFGEETIKKDEKGRQFVKK